jgi:isoleucyl-tRNA synthetase
VRQPLAKILLPILDDKVKRQIQSVEDIIMNEVNIKEIEYVDNTSGIIVKKAKLNFRKLGQQYGPKMKQLSGLIMGMDQDAIISYESQGDISLELEGEKILLKGDDLLIQSEDIPGWLVATEGGITVALDINITDDLRKEGIARDLVNRIQNLRKDMGLDVQDKIRIVVGKNDTTVIDSIQSNKDYICAETQALELEFANTEADYKEMEINEFLVKLNIEVVKPNEVSGV